MTGAAKKYIQDPLYGMVHLSELEMRIIDSQAFQRLLNVKQLGYAYAVFPGADYSRFSHCVGACHIMNRWLVTLERNGTPLPPAQTELYRLAALLHDIGHYPFSHATERAAKNYYASLKTEPEIGENGSTENGIDRSRFLVHEALGSRLVEKDEELSGIITEYALSIDALKRVFQRHELANYANLLSSDVDADRLDFIRRTAHHTGMPYGQIDQQYLITELRLDRDGNLCWTEKALSAIDQILIARYFDYQQLVFNKTVVGLELVLERVVEILLRRKIWDLSVAEIDERVRRKTWIAEDDHFLFEKIHEFEVEHNPDEAESELCKSILSRNPPRRVFQLAFTDWQDLEQRFLRYKSMAQLCIPAWARKYCIDERLWFIWHKAFQFTDWKWGLDVEEHGGEEEYAKVPRILKGKAGASVPIIKEPQSLMHSLYAKRRYDLRVYVVIPEMADPRKRRGADQLRERIARDIESQLTELDREVIGTRSVARFPERGSFMPTLF